MKFTLLLLIALLIGCTATPAPTPPWGGNLSEAARYLQNGHIIVHIRVREERDPTMRDLASLISALVAETAITEGHGLYIVVQKGEWCILIIGVPYGYEGYQTLTYYDIIRNYGVKAIWPTDRIDERVIVCNYAWLLGLHYYKSHPWFPELAAGKPKPLDSAFTFGE